MKFSLKDYGINSLVVNIMDAVLEDERLENVDNADAGVTLAKYVHGRDHDSRTGAGPCRLSESQDVIQCPQPLTLLWADLYSTWNLGKGPSNAAGD